MAHALEQLAFQKTILHTVPLFFLITSTSTSLPQPIIDLSFFIAFFIAKAMASSSPEVQFITTAAGRKAELSTNPCARYDPDIEAKDMPFKPWEPIPGMQTAFSASQTLPLRV
jgi:hypothetical protein